MADGLTIHGARRLLALMVLVFAACVDLTRPSVHDGCADGGPECRSDSGRPDAGADLTHPPDPSGEDDVAPAHDATKPGDVPASGDAAPDDDVAVPVADAAAETRGHDTRSPDVRPPDAKPLDLPRDLAPDLVSAPDLRMDMAIDHPPDASDVPVSVVKGICPNNESALLLCLRFENSLADDSVPPAVVTGNNLTYEMGPGDRAVRVGAASVIRASAGWGSVGHTFTLEAWIRPDRLPTGAQRMGLLDEETRFGLFILPGGTLACYSAGIGVTVPSAVRVGQWSAVACTASSNTLTAWVDGVQRNQVTLDASPTGATANLAIGSNNPSGDAFEGLMDNVRVWSTVRTGAQICQASLGCQ